MSSIDNRIVKMVFDNSQFKSKAEDTLALLTRLKDALSSDKMTSDFDTIDISVSRSQFDGLARSVDEIASRFSNMGIVGMTVLSNLTTAAMNFASNGLQKIMDPIMTGGFNRASAIENARFTLQGLLGDYEEVERVLSDAKDSVDGTAFAFNDAALASASFAATGLRSGEEMQSVLKAIAGTAATANVEYSEIAHIFTTVAGNGRLMTEQLNQFSYRGMNAAATLTKAFNAVLDGSSNLSEEMQEHIRDLVQYGQAEVKDFTGSLDGIIESDLRALVTAGKVDFGTFSAIMAETFGEHAKDANQTFTGSMANIRAALARTGEMFYSGLIKQNGPIVEFFNSIRVAVNGLNAALGPVAEAFTNFASGAIGKVAEFVKAFAWIETVDKENGIKRYSDALQGLAELFHRVTVIIGQLGDIIADVFGISGIDVVAIANDWGAAFLNWTQTIGASEEQLATFRKGVVAFKNVFDGVVAILKTVGSVVSTVIGAILRAFNVSSFLDGIVSLTNAFKKLAESLVPSSSELKDLGDVFYIIFKLIFDVGLIAFNALAKAVDILASALQFVAPVLRTVFRILSIGIDILGLVSRFLKAVIDTIASHVDFSFLTDGLGWILERVREFANLDKFQAKFTEFIDGIKNALDTNEFPFLEGLGDAIEHLKDVLGASAKFISEKAQVIGDALKRHLGKAFEKLHEAISTYWPVIKKKLEEFGIFVSDKFSSAFEKMQEVLSTVSPIVKENLSAIRDAFSEFMSSGKLQELGSAFRELFEAMADVVNANGETLAEKTKDIFSRIREALSDKAVSAVERLTEFLRGLKDGLTEYAPVIQDKLGVLKQAIGGFIEKIGESLGNNKIFSVGNFIGLLISLFMIKKLLDKFKEKGEGKDSPVKKLLDTITETFEKMQQALNATMILTIATAIAEVAGAMFLLSQIDNEKVIAVVVAMYAITKVLESMMNSLKEIKAEDAKGLISAGFSIMLIAAGIIILSEAVRRLGELDFRELVQGLGSVMLLLMAMQSIVENFSSSFSATSGLGLIGMAVALWLLVGPIKELGKMDFLKVAQGLLAVGAAMFEMAAAMRLGSKGGASEGFGMIMMAVALNLLMGPLKELASMEIDPLVQGLKALAVALAEMGIAMAVASSTGGGGASAGLGMLMMAAALNVLMGPLKELSTMNPFAVAGALVALAFALGEMAVALILMQGTLTGAAALVVAAVGLNIFAAALGVIAALPFVAVMVGLLAVAVALAGIAAAAILLSPIIPLMYAFGGALLTLGAGMALIVLSMMGVIVILGLFGAAFLGMLTTVTALIDPILAAVNDLINGLADGIRNNHDGFFEACANLFSALFEAIEDLWNNYILPWWQETSDDMPRKIGEAIGSMIQAIIDAIPDILQGGADLIAGFLDGLLGTSRDGSEVKSAGEEIVDVIGQAISDGWQWLMDKGGEAVQYIIDGVWNGINSIGSTLWDAGSTLASNVWDGFCGLLEINSPSKLFMRGAGSIVEGITTGIKKDSHLAEEGMESLASNMVDAFDSSIVNDYDPTITPVLDLSNIQNGMKSMDGMLGSIPGMYGVDQTITARNMLGMDSMNAMLNDADYSSIVNEIGQLRADINKHSEIMSKMQIVMDTGMLVGELAPGIDRRLGRNVVLAGRRV